MKRRATFVEGSMSEPNPNPNLSSTNRSRLTMQRYTPRMVVVETKEANKRITTRIIITGRQKQPNKPK